ncbi:hypothetical protein KZZ52_41620 [Dactylosporangium sp. AC04546]|uniref:hypothetical protein n=1 Tax=Dactylosporangium sp. AC04546 TaxID=2862460 RepID=UPI001EDE99DB|nr:hypothetical protein [Dactylosporangium sp. AC04546]WVK80426.1 hypothetical protein KZZ52_41620 [Dactylosporangium sp. AC04546]
MNIWDELTLEQFSVMFTAAEQAFLNNVLHEYGMRRKWQTTGDTTSSSDLDEDGMRLLIPRFAEVVSDLVRRGWIRLYESGWVDIDYATPLTAGQVQDAVNDPDSWLMDEDGGRRMVMMMTTDEWDRLAAR